MAEFSASDWEFIENGQRSEQYREEVSVWQNIFTDYIAQRGGLISFDDPRYVEADGQWHEICGRALPLIDAIRSTSSEPIGDEVSEQIFSIVSAELGLGEIPVRATLQKAHAAQEEIEAMAILRAIVSVASPDEMAAMYGGDADWADVYKTFLAGDLFAHNLDEQWWIDLVNEHFAGPAVDTDAALLYAEHMKQEHQEYQEHKQREDEAVRELVDAMELLWKADSGNEGLIPDVVLPLYGLARLRRRLDEDGVHPLESFIGGKSIEDVHVILARCNLPPAQFSSIIVTYFPELSGE